MLFFIHVANILFKRVQFYIKQRITRDRRDSIFDFAALVIWQTNVGVADDLFLLIGNSVFLTVLIRYVIGEVIKGRV